MNTVSQNQQTRLTCGCEALKISFPWKPANQQRLWESETKTRQIGRKFRVESEAKNTYLRITKVPGIFFLEIYNVSLIF